MKFNYKFSNLCGAVYRTGNVLFTPDGSTLLSPTGNRITAFHLTTHRTSTLPVSLPSTTQHLALSPSGHLLLAIDDHGRALFIHYQHRHVLFEFAFGQPVSAVSFSPDGRYVAVGVGGSLLVYHSPSLMAAHKPLTLYRRMTPHHSAITHIDWSSDSHYLLTASTDLTARILTLGDVAGWGGASGGLTLAGHRTTVVAAYWATQEGDKTEPSYRVYTISQDGALLQWRWVHTAAAASPAFGAASSSSSSHPHHPPHAAPGTLSLFGQPGRFILSSKHFFASNTHQSSITATQLHRTSQGFDLLLVAFSSGSFSLYELPAFTLIHSLSVSSSSLTTLAISPSSSWLAVGSSHTSSLLVWEWQSESYILRQQGHTGLVSCLAYTPDSGYIATGGDDGRVKVWNASSGFCFKSFTHHTAPVTSVLFSPAGNVVLSCSGDGTVHCYDLVRYRLFRTLTAPVVCQFGAMCMDDKGELVMVAAVEPFVVYVFALQTGRLLDVLSGHDAPISELGFSNSLSLLLSASWDRTVRVWDPFEGKGCVETLQHDSEVISLAVRNDGLVVATATLHGNVHVWDIRTATVMQVLEVGKDIAGGRSRDDVRTAASRRAAGAGSGGYVTSMCWSADGSCLLLGSNTRHIAIYDVQRKLLIKRFTISRNEALDGVKDQLNSRHVNSLPDDSTAAAADDSRAVDYLPGARTGDKSERRWGRQVRSRCVRFAPTGMQWSAATNEGLLVYALDEEMIFDPTDLGQLATLTIHKHSDSHIQSLVDAVDITPAAVTDALSSGAYSRALLMALRLNEDEHIDRVLAAIPTQHITHVVDTIPNNRLERLLSSLAGHLDTDVALEFYLRFTHALLLRHRNTLSTSLHTYMQLLRRVGRVLARVRGEVGRLCEDNLYMLQVLSDKKREGGGEGEEQEEQAVADEKMGAKVEEVKEEGESEAESGSNGTMVVESKVNGVTETVHGKKSKKRRKAH